MMIINMIRSSACPESRKGMHHEDSFGDLCKILWHDGIGLSLYAKRLDRGRFVWPSATDGVIAITASAMACMLEGIDWRNPQMTWRPSASG